MKASDVWKRVSGSVLTFLASPFVMAAAWFVAAFAAVVWTWGKNPLLFVSPDEALNRLAATLIEEHGRPFLRLPFVDVEDLAHPRFWVTLGEHAVPSYAPVALYVYAALTKIPIVGLWLIPALPASAAAAFTLGTARLLPRGRRWLAMLSPTLGFPALYWLLRPWVNISLLLVCLCWAFFFWANWLNAEKGKSRTRWLLGALAFVGAAASIRPDCAAYLMLAALLFALAESQGEGKLVFLFVFGAGTAAVVANLVLNFVITGHPLQAAYQIFMDRMPGEATPTFLPGILNSLLTPMGLHTPQEIWKFFVKYWLTMRPLGLLVIGQVSLLPLLLAMPRRKRLFYLAAIVVVILFAVSRLSDDVYGAKVMAGYVHHSVPRYLTPVYLLAALPPLLFLGRCRMGVTMVYGTVFACILAVRSGYEICVHQPDSLKFLRSSAASSERTVKMIEKRVPARALVYTATQDKILWSRWHVGTLGNPRPTAASMRRAFDADLPVFVVEPRIGSGKLRSLRQALKAKRLNLATLDGRRGLFQLQPLSAAPRP